MADKLVIDCSKGQSIEQNYTEEEKQAIEQQKLRESLTPNIIAEPVDTEKVAMSEALIDLEARLSALENK
jgi:hypothetical protein